MRVAHRQLWGNDGGDPQSCTAAHVIQTAAPGEVLVSSVQTSDPSRHVSLCDGSSQMRAIGTIIENVADTDATVLIRGESGVGKDLVARAIHASSSRRHGPFVKINCAAIPSGLIESELFGHERGAFTGANRRKPGQ